MAPPKKDRSKEYATRKMERLGAKLAAAEDYYANVPAELRRLLENRAKPDDILEFAASLAAARLVTELASTKSTTAMDAARQILDRVLGRAVERVQTHHKFEKMSEEQIDALLLSKLKEVGENGKQE